MNPRIKEAIAIIRSASARMNIAQLEELADELELEAESFRTIAQQLGKVKPEGD